MSWNVVFSQQEGERLEELAYYVVDGGRMFKSMTAFLDHATGQIKSVSQSSIYTPDSTFVSSVNGMHGNVLLGTGDIPETDGHLYYSDARVAAYAATVAGQPNGFANLDSNGKIFTSQLPAIAITNTFVVSSEADMLALAANTGDVAVRTDIDSTFILQGSDPTVLGNWVELISSAPVLSVNSLIGNVVLTTDNIAEGSIHKYFSGKTTDNLPQGATNRYYSSTLFSTDLATKTTDNLAQGSTNKYYTTSLFNADLATKTTSNLAEGSNLYYTSARFDTAFSTKTTDNLAQGSTNKYYNSSLFNADLATKTTSNLTEGSNLYFTQARVLATPLTGFTTGTNSTVLATDTVLQAFGKAQTQISTHAARHLPSGADALTTAAAVSTGIANAVGSANSFSRADHVHNTEVARTNLTATDTQTTTSLTFGTIPSMSATPAAGTYMVIFSGSFVSANNGSDRSRIAIFSGGVEVADSERIQATSGGAEAVVFTSAIVTVNGSQAVEAQWTRTGGNTITVYQRSMQLIRLGA